MAVGAAHSALVRQLAQSPALLQNGVGAAQPAFEVQPLLHSLSPLQMGADAGQSALPKHCTHLPSRPKQKGAAAPHWVLFAQALHCLVVGLQMGRPVPAHSMSEPQPMHCPVAASHFGASPGQLPAAHAGRH